jgi:hypothetical protein
MLSHPDFVINVIRDAIKVVQGTGASGLTPEGRYQLAGTPCRCRGLYRSR